MVDLRVAMRPHQFRSRRAPNVADKVGDILVCGHVEFDRVCVLPQEHAIHQAMPAAKYTRSDYNRALFVLGACGAILFLAGVELGVLLVR